MRLRLWVCWVAVTAVVACGGVGQHGCTVPSSPPGDHGVAYSTSAPLACGDGAIAWFAGHPWKATTAWSKAPSVHAQTGCGDKQIAGTMTLVDSNNAVFQTQDGETIQFVPTVVGCA